MWCHKPIPFTSYTTQFYKDTEQNQYHPLTCYSQMLKNVIMWRDNDVSSKHHLRNLFTFQEKNGIGVIFFVQNGQYHVILPANTGIWLAETHLRYNNII